MTVSVDCRRTAPCDWKATHCPVSSWRRHAKERTIAEAERPQRHYPAKKIDNDVFDTDVTFGFNTALGITGGAEAILHRRKGGKNFSIVGNAEGAMSLE